MTTFTRRLTTLDRAPENGDVIQNGEFPCVVDNNILFFYQNGIPSGYLTEQPDWKKYTFYVARMDGGAVTVDMEIAEIPIPTNNESDGPRSIIQNIEIDFDKRTICPLFSPAQITGNMIIGPCILTGRGTEVLPNSQEIFRACTFTSTKTDEEETASE